MDVRFFSAVLQNQAKQWDPSHTTLTGSPSKLHDQSRSCNIVPQGQSKIFSENVGSLRFLIRDSVKSRSCFS